MKETHFPDPTEIIAGVISTADDLGTRAVQGVKDALSRSRGPAQPYQAWMDGKQFIVEAAVPGFTKSEVSVAVKGTMLKLVATPKTDKKSKLEKFGLTELVQSVPLPPGARAAEMTAEYVNGVLKVVVPVDELPPVKVVG